MEAQVTGRKGAIWGESFYPLSTFLLRSSSSPSPVCPRTEYEGKKEYEGHRHRVTFTLTDPDELITHHGGAVNHGPMTALAGDWGVYSRRQPRLAETELAARNFLLFADNVRRNANSAPDLPL